MIESRRVDWIRPMKCAISSRLRVALILAPGRNVTNASSRFAFRADVSSPGWQVSGITGCHPGGTSQRATTRPPVGRPWRGRVRWRRGPPTDFRSAGLHQVDGVDTWNAAGVRWGGRAEPSLGRELWPTTRNNANRRVGLSEVGVADSARTRHLPRSPRSSVDVRTVVP